MSGAFRSFGFSSNPTQNQFCAPRGDNARFDACAPDPVRQFSGRLPRTSCFSALPRPGADTASQLIAVPARPLWPLASAVNVSNANRAVYPYSVIPGGAESSEELRQAADTDPVVAEHYSDFNIARVRRVTLNAPQLVYVSYRVGNSVYWTKNKLMLAKGEAVLTDGRSMARVRCGNRISAAPVRPNLATEPSVEDFNAPIFPPSLSTPYLAASSVPPAGFPPGQSSEFSASPGSSSVPGGSVFSASWGRGRQRQASWFTSSGWWRQELLPRAAVALPLRAVVVALHLQSGYPNRAPGFWCSLAWVARGSCVATKKPDNV